MKALAKNDVKVLMVDGHFSDFVKGSCYRCVVNKTDFILLDENKLGYKCSKDDFYNDFSLVIGEYVPNDDYEYLDLEGNSIVVDDERKIVPASTPIVDICDRKLTLDALQRNGNIYVRAEKMDCNDKVYSSYTAEFTERLLVIDNGREEFCW